ncbi:MAG: HEPN domain-containing protein [bacterium]|nr:HEPN domain-containing protein [Candidatus Margulisiibacteriota bacterium]
MDEKTLSLVKEWIHKAKHDIGMAELALSERPEYTDAICNHCQQAAEKHLKAYLTFLGISFEKKHDLDYLLDLLKEKDASVQQFYDMAEELNSYAVEIRYPDDWFEPSKEEAQKALDIAKKIQSYVLSKINLTSI